jgi:hypothetical protein
MAFIVMDIVPVLVMNQAPEGMILVVARPAKAARGEAVEDHLAIAVPTFLQIGHMPVVTEKACAF